MSLTNSKALALGAALFSANAAADLAGYAFADSVVDPTTVIKANEYPVIGDSDVNVNKQFKDSCLAVGALSALLATGLGAACFDGLKMPKRESAPDSPPR